MEVVVAIEAFVALALVAAAAVAATAVGVATQMSDLRLPRLPVLSLYHGGKVLFLSVISGLSPFSFLPFEEAFSLLSSYL